MGTTIRPAVAGDAEACGRVMHAAFKGIADAHGFPPDSPSAEVGTRHAAALIASPAAFGVVAEGDDGRVVGSNFPAEGDPIRAVGPIAVDPARRGGGVGRRLMRAGSPRPRRRSGWHAARRRRLQSPTTRAASTAARGGRRHGR